MTRMLASVANAVEAGVVVQLESRPDLGGGCDRPPPSIEAVKRA